MQRHRKKTSIPVDKDIIVVIPVGPGSSTDFVIDTIQSFIDYTHCSYKVILIDDSHEKIGLKIKEFLPEIKVLETKKRMGGWAGLYITLAEGYHYALNHYRFKALLKLDTDALVIGPEPEKEAMELFSKNKSAGIAGQYPNDYTGRPWDIAWPRQRIINATCTWKFLRSPLAHWMLRREFHLALQNGYRTGESVFGGAYFMSYLLLKTFARNELLPNHLFRTLNLGEDHLFALLAKACCFQLVSLSRPEQSFACAWKGLPASPHQLHSEGKKIIHSVRSYQSLDETQIRQFFAEKRTQHKQKLLANSLEPIECNCSISKGQ